MIDVEDQPFPPSRWKKYYDQLALDQQEGVDIELATIEDEETRLARESAMTKPRGCSKCYGRGYTGKLTSGEYIRCKCTEDAP